MDEGARHPGPSQLGRKKPRTGTRRRVRRRHAEGVEGVVRGKGGGERRGRERQKRGGEAEEISASSGSRWNRARGLGGGRGYVAGRTRENEVLV